MNYSIILCIFFLLIFSNYVFCLNKENEILNNSKLNLNNKNIDVDQYNHDYSEYDENDANIAENIKEDIFSKHFSSITPRNNSIAHSLDLLNLLVKNISLYEKFKNIFKNFQKI